MGGPVLATSDLRKGMEINTAHITDTTDITDIVDIVVIITVAMIGAMSIVTGPMIIGVMGITKGAATGAGKKVIRGIIEAITKGTTKVTIRASIAEIIKVIIKVITKASTKEISKVNINMELYSRLSLLMVLTGVLQHAEINGLMRALSCSDVGGAIR